MAGVAATTIASPKARENPKMKDIPDVDIDKNGKFKYILVKVHDPDKDQEFKHIVRGYSRASYHADIFDEISDTIETKGLDCEVVGGGRIEHEPHKKSLKVYGFSQGYGQADHKITAAILSKKFPNYDNVTWSFDGY